jgi:hypothetical protein
MENTKNHARRWVALLAYVVAPLVGFLVGLYVLIFILRLPIRFF